MYSGVKISEVVESGKGIGGVMALLWFQVSKIKDHPCSNFQEKKELVGPCFSNSTELNNFIFSGNFLTTSANLWNYV